MEKVNGGAVDIHESCFFVGEGTVVSDLPGQVMCNGQLRTTYKIHGETGKDYDCVWTPKIDPMIGTRVRIKYHESGLLGGHYTADLI